ncbi:hypothetical protein [Kitasatospora aureofaciens]|uniref:hypothetical protein n=1 Tax=Kitasatospora aureofaciens TaxID=1894 RepID=UPI00380DCFB0
MTDFVSRLLGHTDAGAPPIRPLIGSIFEPRRGRMRYAEGELTSLTGGADGLSWAVEVPQLAGPAGAAERRAASDAPPIRAEASPAERPVQDGTAVRGRESVAKEGSGTPGEHVPERQQETVALPKPRRGPYAEDDLPPLTGGTAGLPEVPEEHATPVEPAGTDAPTAAASPPIRAQHSAPPHPATPPPTPRRERAAAPSVHITIGRVEVRAQREAPVPPPRKLPERRPSMSLEDYLRTRAQGEGR